MLSFLIVLPFCRKPCLYHKFICIDWFLILPVVNLVRRECQSINDTARFVLNQSKSQERVLNEWYWTNDDIYSPQSVEELVDWGALVAVQNKYQAPRGPDCHLQTRLKIFICLLNLWKSCFPTNILILVGFLVQMFFFYMWINYKKYIRI